MTASGLTSPADAVALVRTGDTVMVGGPVGAGTSARGADSGKPAGEQPLTSPD
jgi:acyl CoA:acetate/3-ketoacid CoA transferase alpha subunit